MCIRDSMAHYIRLRYHWSEDDPAQRLYLPQNVPMPSYASCWATEESAHSTPNHHIEYIGQHWDIDRCSWPITFGYDIIEAKMTRLKVSTFLTMKLCHRMSPDEPQRRYTFYPFSVVCLCFSLSYCFLWTSWRFIPTASLWPMTFLFLNAFWFMSVECRS